MVKVYLVRHGKTMFNTIGRAQGWSDTPLTAEGELGITELGLGFKERGIKFDAAYSSDSGRTIQTMGFILRNSDNEGIPYEMDKRIREWCFGSFDGAYDGELFDGVLPRKFADAGRAGGDLAEIANAIYEVDTAGWAEPWEVLRDRILTGFHDMAERAEKRGDKNIVIVSHGLTISTFVKLLRPDKERPHALDNGSVTLLDYADGKFKIEAVGSMEYRKLGWEIMKQNAEKN
ncbi:histidine phosphatase family protein [Lactococcus termiticola]|uniref:Phosphoglycerate mutase n=1 Tax=Lactococcus termiticola TaxID=2169526 RepID=A0A2R5HF32_9LACT|nr:histidine phosphatase family protein [Lactococcus termiticola]GBG96632.1 phosphoglycerate mutase [Lactococcus termiticola]